MNDVIKTLILKKYCAAALWINFSKAFDTAEQVTLG